MARHERRKAMVLRKTTMRASEFAALPSVCAWDGCEATCTHKENEYLPKGWTMLLAFWSAQPVANVLDVPARDWLRDAILCPQHTAALDGLLKPLGREIMNRKAEGSA
jgi:hypothetical protein